MPIIFKFRFFHSFRSSQSNLTLSNGFTCSTTQKLFYFMYYYFIIIVIVSTKDYICNEHEPNTE